MADDPEYDIAITSLNGAAAASESGIQCAVAAALQRHDILSARISVAIVDDARIAQLNETHLGHLGPTDVLTFDLRDDADCRTGDHLVVDGEIVLSLETATREALRRGHALEAEAALYAVHGTLHLLGYDDRSDEDAERMHAMEDDILQSAGIGIVFRRSDSCM